MKEADRLLELYKQLWNNRSLHHHDGKGGNGLWQAMRTELKDELAHPRTRKKPVDKYVIAVKRIIDSTLEDSEKLLLIKEFTSVLHEIKKES